MGIEMTIGTVLFFVSIFVVVLLAKKHTSTVRDYLIGNSNVGGVVSAFTWTAAAASAGLFLGSAGLAYQFGWPGLMYQLGVFGSMFISWVFVIPRLRRVAVKASILTTADYLSLRFGEEKVKLISGLWTIVFIIPMIIIQLVGAGYLIESTLGISYFWGMIILGLTIAISTQFSGFMGVAWLDTLQGTIMTVGTIIMVYTSMKLVGGFSSLNVQLAAIDPNLIEFSGSMPKSLQIGLIVSYLVAFWGQPHLTARVWGLKDSTAVRSAFPISMALGAIWAFGAGLIGLSARVLKPGLAKPDLAMPAMISGLPPIYTALLFFTLIAAMMTTANSLLLAVAGTVGNDIAPRFLKTQKHDSQLIVTKLAVLVIGILSFVLALKPPALILEINAFAFGGFALIFGIPLFLGVAWKKANLAGAKVSLIISPIVYIGWKLFLVEITGIHEMVGALFVSILLILISTVIGKKPTPQMGEIFALGKTPKDDRFMNTPEDELMQKLKA